MNLLDQAYWFEIARNLFILTAATVALAFLATRCLRSAYWQRTTWQIAFVSIAILGVSEMSGLSKGMALWFGGKKRVEPRFTVKTFAPATALPRIEEDVAVAVEPTFSPLPVHEETSMLWPGLLWMSGAAVILARVLFSQALLLGFRVRRKALEDTMAIASASRLATRLGLSRNIVVRQSPALRSPIAFGIFRKTIVLPENFSQMFNPTQREAILAHELAHLAFNDPAWYLVADLVTALFWWNPLVWLARRQFHAASENAADEASLLVQDGATTLAECLVHLAKQFASRGAFGWMSIEGNGFRSNLARRVERLLTLQNTEWKVPRPPAVLALKFFVPILLVALVIVSSAFAQRDRTQPRDLNSAINLAWNDSIGALALNSVTTPSEPSVANEQPATTVSAPLKPKVSPSVLKKETPLNPLVTTTDPALTPVQEAAAKAAATAAQSFAKTNVASMSAAKKKLLSNLNSIHVANFSFSGLPLGEVVKTIVDLSVQNDPEQKGISLMITGLNAELRLPNVTLAPNIPLSDILNEMCMVAPIQYAIEDDGVVLTTNRSFAKALFSRVFRIDPNATFDALKKVGVLKQDWAHLSSTNRTQVLNGALRDYFIAAGVNLDPPRFIFYNDSNGTFLVRAPREELETIAMAVEVINVIPPQVVIEAKFAEISSEDAKELGFDWLLKNSTGTTTNLAQVVTTTNASTVHVGTIAAVNQTPVSVSGILSEAQMRRVVRALEERHGVDILTAPRVTTLSGRQAQISSLDLVTVVTGVSSVKTADGTVTNTFQTEPLPFGPVLDVIPWVSADGYSISLTLIPTVTEFLGYDVPDKNVQKASDAMMKTSIQVPLPRLRLRQVTTQATVWDGQTIVLGGLIAEKINKVKDKVPILGDIPFIKSAFRKERTVTTKKNLVIFVTARIIDHAGNTVHTMEEMTPLIKKNPTPKQETLAPRQIESAPPIDLKSGFGWPGTAHSFSNAKNRMNAGR